MSEDQTQGGAPATDAPATPTTEGEATEAPAADNA